MDRAKETQGLPQKPWINGDFSPKKACLVHVHIYHVPPWLLQEKDKQLKRCHPLSMFYYKCREKHMKSNWNICYTLEVELPPDVMMLGKMIPKTTDLETRSPLLALSHVWQICLGKRYGRHAGMGSPMFGMAYYDDSIWPFDPILVPPIPLRGSLLQKWFINVNHG